MQKLGYIISSRKIKNLPSYIVLVKDKREIDDATKPILYVGYQIAKQNIEDFNPLQKEYPNNVFWTFEKTDKRNIYEEDLKKYTKFCINNLIKNLKYYYINILTLPLKKAKKLFEIINSASTKYIYISEGMIYLYYDNYVMGISTDIMKFCGINVGKTIKKIESNSANIITFDDSFLDNEIKLSINNKKYATAYFMSMR